MKTYFNLQAINNSDELKKAFRALCITLHPDKGGDAEEFKAMMSEYERIAPIFGIDNEPADEWMIWAKSMKETTSNGAYSVGEHLKGYEFGSKFNNISEAIFEAEDRINDGESLADHVVYMEVQAVITMTDEQLDALRLMYAIEGLSHGGTRTIEDRRGNEHFVNLVTVIKTDSRVFFADAQGHDYARYIYLPCDFEKLDEYAQFRAAREAREQEEKEEAARREAERIAHESAEVAKWSRILEKLPQMPAYSWETRKDYQKAEQKQKAAMKRNVKAVFAHFFPGVKVTVKDRGKTWCESSAIEWIDGPTVAEVKEVAELYRFVGRGYSFDAYSDYGHYTTLNDWKTWREMFGAFSDTDISFVRTVSEQVEARIDSAFEASGAEFEGNDESGKITRNTGSCLMTSEQMDKFAKLCDIPTDEHNGTHAEQETAHAFRVYCWHESEGTNAEGYAMFRVYREILIKYAHSCIKVNNSNHKATESTEETRSASNEAMTPDEAGYIVCEAINAGQVTATEEGEIMYYTGDTYRLSKAFRAMGCKWDKTRNAWAVKWTKDDTTEDVTTSATALEETTSEPQQGDTAQVRTEGNTEPTAANEGQTVEASASDPLADALAEALRKVEELRKQMEERDAQREREAEEERKRLECERREAIRKASDELEKRRERFDEAESEYNNLQEQARELAERIASAAQRMEERRAEVAEALRALLSLRGAEDEGKKDPESTHNGTENGYSAQEPDPTATGSPLRAA